MLDTSIFYFFYNAFKNPSFCESLKRRFYLNPEFVSSIYFIFHLISYHFIAFIYFVGWETLESTL